MVRVCQANVKEGLQSREVKEFCKEAVTVKDHGISPGQGDT